MVEIDIVAEVEYLDACFHLIKKKQQCRKTDHPIMVVNGRTAKRVIYIPTKTSEIHFSPAELKAQIDIRSIKFVKLTTTAAVKFMHKKLLTYRPDKNYKVSIHLWRHYEQLFRQQQKSEADYAKWLDKREYNLLKKEFHIHSSVVISIVVDISGKQDPEKALRTLQSVKQQTYKSWVLILIMERSVSTSNIKKLIDSLDEKFKAIIYRKSAGNLYISDFSQYSDSNYFLHLSTDSILSKHALSIFAHTVQKTTTKSCIIYSDHDSIDQNGIRFSPIFKPDWNPDLILSNNYIGSNVLIHKSLLHDSPVILADKYENWVYELLIRSVIFKHKVTHITCILSHNLNNSRDDACAKHGLQLKTLKKYLSPHGTTVQFGKKACTYKVSWPLPATPPLVSIIIPTRDGLETLKRTIDSVLKNTQYKNFEVLVIDNQSQKKETMQYLDIIKKYNNIRVLTYDAPFNYSAINNYAVRHAKGSVITLLNNDVKIISPNWLHEMVSHSIRSDIGCVGAMLYYPDNRIQHAGVIVGLGGCAGHSHKFYKRGDHGYADRLLCTQNYSAVTAACLTIEKDIFEQIGGLNEKSLTVAFNDVDLCLKALTAGYRNVWTPWAELYHYESLSRGHDDTKEKRLRLNSEISYMKETWKTTTIADPYYNKFLTRIREDFSLGL